jgi:hypothetical protein
MEIRNEKKILGVKETPILLNGVTFYSQMAVIPLRGENLSSEQWKDKNAEYTLSSSYKNSIGLDLLVKLCEGQNSIIEKQATQIKELQDQLADYEQELYDIVGKHLIFEQSSCMEETT